MTKGRVAFCRLTCYSANKTRHGTK